MKITYTDIRSFLNRCVFNPKKIGPLSIIADVGNPDYFELRACEFIKESQHNTIHLRDYDDKIIKAIQLLCLARETRYKELLDNESKNNTETTKS